MRWWLLALPHYLVVAFLIGAAYAALMTDAYPPFRLEMGGNEPPTDIVPPMPAPVTS